MSIATAISRLQGLRDRLVTRLTAWKFNNLTDLEDCVDAIESISGTWSITSTAVQDVIGHGNRYAQVSDNNLVPGNIVSGVSILGVTGTASASPPQANLTTGALLYGGATAPSTLNPPSGYDGFSSVVPYLTDANPALVASNIKNGATIMGVTGTYQTPTEAKTPTLSELVSGGITNNSVDITPASGKHLSQVTIPRITKDDGTAILASDIKYGASILGIQGSYYAYQHVFKVITMPSDSRYMTIDNIGVGTANDYHIFVAKTGGSVVRPNEVVSCFYKRFNSNTTSDVLYVDSSVENIIGIPGPASFIGGTITLDTGNENVFFGSASNNNNRQYLVDVFLGDIMPYDAEIEYLQSSGTQYIDTGFVPNQDSRLVMDVLVPTLNTGSCTFGGSANGAWTPGFSVYGGNTTYQMASVYNTSDVTASTSYKFTANNRYTVDLNKNVYNVYKNGTLQYDYTRTAGTFTLTKSIDLFRIKIATPRYGKFRLYSAQIYDDGTLVRDYIPVRVGSVGYLYDKVSKQLYGNDGTGSFTLGADKT